MPLTIGTAGGNKDPYEIRIGTADGDKIITEGWVGTAGGNKQFFTGLDPLSASATSDGWSQVEPGNPYYFSATCVATGGSGSYSFLWSDGATGFFYYVESSDPSPPQIDIYCTVTDTVTGYQAVSNTVSSHPPP